MISVTEIVLIIAGILAVILGYLIPNGHGVDSADVELTEQIINEMVRKAVQNSQGQIDDLLDECMEDAINKAERAMDRVTNEKMSAISEYSDTVMNDIHKNHDEVMFMYDMLNDKHKNLRNTVSEVTRTAKEVKQTAEEAAITAEHAEAAARTAREAALKAESSTAFSGRNMVVAEPVAPANVITPQKAPEPEFEYYDEDDYADEEIPSPVGQDIIYKEETVDPEVPEFASLGELLDRADSKETETEGARVIGYGQEPENQEIFEENVYSDNTNPDDVYYDNSYEDNSYVEEPAANVNETSEAGYSDMSAEPGMVVTPQPQPVLQPVQQPAAQGAKVVSISDASRKKAVEREEHVEQPVEKPTSSLENAADPISRNQRILDMHKQGKSAVVIARELRLGIGEVKLVIDLASKHKKNRSSIM